MVMFPIISSTAAASGLSFLDENMDKRRFRPLWAAFAASALDSGASLSLSFFFLLPNPNTIFNDLAGLLNDVTVRDGSLFAARRGRAGGEESVVVSEFYHMESVLE